MPVVFFGFFAPSSTLFCDACFSASRDKTRTEKIGSLEAFLSPVCTVLKFHHHPKSLSRPQSSSWLQCKCNVYIHSEANGRHAFKVNVPYNLNDRSIRAKKCQKKTIHKEPSVQQWQVVIKLSSSPSFPFLPDFGGETQPSNDLRAAEWDTSINFGPFFAPSGSVFPQGDVSITHKCDDVVVFQACRLWYFFDSFLWSYRDVPKWEKDGTQLRF